MSQANNNFDFDAFNKLTNNIPAGLQVFLAQQLMANATWSYSKYGNVREEEANSILTEIKLLRAQLKQDAADRARKEIA